MFKHLFKKGNVSIDSNSIIGDNNIISLDESSERQESLSKYVFQGNSGTIRISDGNVWIDGKKLYGGQNKSITIEINGDVENVFSDGSVNVKGNVANNVDAKGSVNAGDVGGDVKAGGSVTAGKIKGSVKAGGSVTCF